MSTVESLPATLQARESTDVNAGEAPTISSNIDALSTSSRRATFSCWSLSSAALRASMSVQRSEEHTSELQSRRDLVCRLLLEKKKITNISSNTLATHD